MLTSDQNVRAFVRELANGPAAAIYDLLMPEIGQQPCVVGELIDTGGQRNPALLCIPDESRIAFYMLDEPTDSGLPPVRWVELARPTGVRVSEVRGTVYERGTARFVPGMLILEHESFPGRFECDAAHVLPELRERFQTWL